MTPKLQQIICLILLLFFIWLIKSLSKTNSAGNRGGYVLFWFVAVMFSLFYNSGYDYFGYEKIFNEYRNSGYKFHMENFYYYLIDLLPNSYLLWRFVIWGGAAFLWVLACKQMKCNSAIAALFLLSMPLFQYFYYLRETFAMGFLLLSICMLQTKDIEKRKKFWAYIILFGSIFLHKSIIVYLLIYFLAIRVPFNKLTVLISILILPILRLFVGQLASGFLSWGIFDNSLTQTFGDKYLAGETMMEYNANGYLRLFITFFPIVYAIVFNVVKTIKSNHEGEYLILVNFSYYIFYLFLLFWDNTGQTEMAIRFMETSSVPIAFYMAYNASQNMRLSKNDKVVVSASVFYICFTLLLTVFFYH